jgi:hypothetical protein
VGDREILETYLNSASKNTSERDSFPHGTKSLLTSVICVSAERLWLFKNGSAPYSKLISWGLKVFTAVLMKNFSVIRRRVDS